MAARFLLGADIGFGSLKVTIIDGEGNVAGSASREIASSYPRPGWSEQDPDDWYTAFCESAPAALAQAGIPAGEIAALAFSAGAHTPVLLGRDGRPLRPAILWNDQRSADEARWLDGEFGERILATGYQRPYPTWTLPQLLWLRRHEPEIAGGVAKLLVAKDYLRFRVTGAWHTDEVDALGTLMLDAAKREWSPELCGFIDWPLETLPPIVKATAVVGEVTRECAEASGLQPGTPVVAGSSDTAVEAFGAGAIEPGQGVVKLATAGTVSVITAEPRPVAGLFTYYYVVPGLWYEIAGTNSCASAHRWLRDRLFPPEGEVAGDEAFARMDELASGIPAGSDGLIFHPYLLGERSPYWDPELRADFIGLTMRHDRGHLVRALYEGVAFSLRDCALALAGHGLTLAEARIIGGGAQSAVWRQVVSDVLAIPLALPEHVDASFGAALLAGVGVGVFADERDAARRCVRTSDLVLPDRRRQRLYDDLFEVYRDAQQALAPISHRLGRIAASPDP